MNQTKDFPKQKIYRSECYDEFIDKIKYFQAFIYNLKNKTVQHMNEIMLEQAHSFDNKMENISKTNHLLDELERKMNAYFTQNETQEKHLLSDGMGKPSIDEAEKEEFDSYGFRGRQPEEPKIDLSFPKKEEEEPRFSADQGERKSKKNDTFKLFHKNIQKRNPSQEVKSTQSFINSQSKPPIYPMNVQRTFKPNSHLEPQQSQSSNSFVRELETIQHLMSQKVKIKQQRITQLQQQLLTENEERVYLYKVNVRLEEELSMLNDLENQNKNNTEWQIEKLKAEIQTLKNELDEKKLQRKQLKKQEQVLKDGYKTILRHRKEFVKKDIVSQTPGSASSNDQVLMNLLGELEKLKGVVEKRIKSVSRKKIHSRI